MGLVINTECCEQVACDSCGAPLYHDKTAHEFDDWPVEDNEIDCPWGEDLCPECCFEAHHDDEGGHR